MDIDALADKYGSGKSTVPMPTTGSADVDALADKYGGKSIVAPAKVEPSQDTPLDPQDPKNFVAMRLGKPPSNTSPPNQFVEDVKNAPAYVYNKTGENYRGSRDLVTKGVTDFGKGLTASGASEIGMGLIGMPLALPSAVISGTAKMGNKLGSDIGTRGTEVLTSGLPVGSGFKYAASNLMPSNRAISKIAEAVGPENLAEGLQRLRENPRLAPADVFPAVRSMAQGLATEVGPHQTKLLKAVEERGGGAKNAVERAYNETMGSPVNVLDKLEEMKKSAREVGAKQINPIVEKSKPADVTAVIDAIDKDIGSTPVGAATLKQLKNGLTPDRDLGPTQSRLFQLRNEIRGNWKDRKDMFAEVNGDQGLHRIQKDLRYEAQTLLDGQGSDKLLGAKLMKYRNMLVNAIDAQHGGDYKAGLGKYRDEMYIQDAFDKGQDILRNRPTKFEDRPEFWADWKKNASDAELKAAREGARLAVDQQINGMRFAAKKGTDIPEIDFNAQKLKLLFGEKEVKQMFKTLKDEKDIADTNQKIWQGSQTQFREGGQRAIAVRPDYHPNLTSFLAPAAELGMNAYAGIPVVGMASVLGYQGVRKGMTKLGQGLDRKTNRELAELSLSTGERREALIEALSKHLPQTKLGVPNTLKLLSKLPIAATP